MKKCFAIILLSLLCANLFAQYDEDEQVRDSGVDFFIGGGVYMAGKGTANYYSGIPSNAKTKTGGNTLGYLFGNASWKESLARRINENNPHISLDNLSKVTLDYPEDMRYSPAMLIQLGVRYRFTRNFSMSILYSFARCKAKDVFLLHYKTNELGNEYNDYLTYDLVGKENRSFIDLMFTYLFDSDGYVEPFLEVGAQFNYVKVKSFDAIIEGDEYSLLDKYNGTQYVANTSMQTFDVNYGGAGFGFTAAIGLKIKASKVVSLDPLFFVGESYINLGEPYKKFTFNYGAEVRIVMNDSFFSKNN